MKVSATVVLRTEVSADVNNTNNDRRKPSAKKVDSVGEEDREFLSADVNFAVSRFNASFFRRFQLEGN